jgi:hypothetical protein
MAEPAAMVRQLPGFFYVSSVGAAIQAEVAILPFGRRRIRTAE